MGLNKEQLMKVFEDFMIPAVRAEIDTRLSQIEFRLGGLEKLHGVPKGKSIKDMYKKNEFYESERHPRT